MERCGAIRKEVFIMRSVKIMKTAKISYVVMSLLFGVLGILLLIKPEIISPVLAGVFGALLILFGTVKLIGYFSKDLFRLAFQYDLALGLLLIALGMITILKTDQLMVFISIVTGVYVLVDGLLKVQTAFDARVFGIEQWWLILVAAVLTGVAGGLLVFRPYKGAEFLTVMLGLCFLTEGMLNLITVLTAVRIIRHQQPDSIDVIDVIDVAEFHG